MFRYLDTSFREVSSVSEGSVCMYVNFTLANYLCKVVEFMLP